MGLGSPLQQLMSMRLRQCGHMTTRASLSPGPPWEPLLLLQQRGRWFRKSDAVWTEQDSNPDRQEASGFSPSTRVKTSSFSSLSPGVVRRSTGARGCGLSSVCPPSCSPSHKQPPPASSADFGKAKTQPYTQPLSKTTCVVKKTFS